MEGAQRELRRKVQAIEENDWKAAPNPISAARDVWLLQESEQPEAREQGNIVAAVGELRDEVRSLGRRVSQAEGSSPTDTGGYIPGALRQLIVTAVSKNEPIAEGDLEERFPALSRNEFRSAVTILLDEREIYVVDGKLSTIPF